MAAPAHRQALQTALLSVRGLRRRRLGHVGPEHFPNNNLDKWGRKNAKNGAPANLLGLGGERRPAPRASLVLGGGPNRRRRGNSHTNGNGMGAAMMEQQRASVNGRRGVEGVNGSSLKNDGTNGFISKTNGHTNGLDVQLRGATAKAESKSPGGYSSDLVVVLDMDECLIHSQFLSDRLVDKYRQVEERPSSERGRGEHEEAFLWSHCDSFRIKLPDGDLVNVNKRPNLDLFLKEITNKFETYVFTAAMEVYASPVLNMLDPDGSMFAGRFYREHCVYEPDVGAYAKNLCDVMRMRKALINGSGDDEDASSRRDGDAFECDERRVVLVDNNPLSFLPNPSNGILVSSFYDDPKDDTLEAVMELLHELDGSDDVRPILDDKFGLRDALDDVVKGTAVGW